MWCEEGGGSGPLTSVCGLQHGLAEGQVPVVLRTVLLKVLPCHVLRGALLKFHFSEAAVLRCALGGEKGTLSDPSPGESHGETRLRVTGGTREETFVQADA